MQIYSKQKSITILKILKQEMNLLGDGRKLAQIRERDIRISDRVMDIFYNWISNQVNSENKGISQEGLKTIELIKDRWLEDYL